MSEYENAVLLIAGCVYDIWIIFNKTMGYHEWLESGRYPILFLISSYGPAFANVLTRLITTKDIIVEQSTMMSFYSITDY